MSTRTIFEINHDYWHEIEREPDAFLKALHSYLAAANDKNAERLEHFGIRRAWWGHHSTDRKVVTTFSEYKL